MSGRVKSSEASDIEDHDVSVSASPHLEWMEMKSDSDEYELALQVVDGDYEEGGNPVEMVMPRSVDGEHVNSGLETYEEWLRLSRPNCRDWELQTGKTVAHDERDEVDGRRAQEVTSPSYDEMDQLRQKYEPRIEATDTEEEAQSIRQEMWDEAQNMELEGYEPEVFYLQRIPEDE